MVFSTPCFHRSDRMYSVMLCYRSDTLVLVLGSRLALADQAVAEAQPDSWLKNSTIAG